jgi:hypothetical protein
MRIGDDLANIVAKAGIDITSEGLKLSKEASIEILKLLLELLKERQILKPGKNNLSKLLNSGQELKMTKMKKSDVKLFASKAKKYGIPYSIIREGKNYSVIYGSRDIDLIKTLFEKIQEERMGIGILNKVKNSIKKIQIGILKNLNSNLEKKLAKLQYGKDFRETDLANDNISPTEHDEKNDDNKKNILTKQSGERYEEKKDDLIKDRQDYKKNTSLNTLNNTAENRESVLKKFKEIDIDKVNKNTQAITKNISKSIRDITRE